MLKIIVAYAWAYLRRCLVMSSSEVHSGRSARGRNLSPMNLSTDDWVVRPSDRAVRSMDDTQLCIARADKKREQYRNTICSVPGKRPLQDNHKYPSTKFQDSRTRLISCPGLPVPIFYDTHPLRNVSSSFPRISSLYICTSVVSIRAYIIT